MKGKTYKQFFKYNILSFLIKFKYKILEKDKIAFHACV